MSGDRQLVLRPSSDDETCDGRTINERYRLAKVSARDERRGLVALDDGRGSSPESATFSDGTLSKENLQHAIGTALTDLILQIKRSLPQARMMIVEKPVMISGTGFA